MWSSGVYASPRVAGRIVWDPAFQSVSGIVTFALPEGSSRGSEANGFDDFWLLPNRDLERLSQDEGLTREQLEFSRISAEKEWPFEESGLGAVVVSGVGIASLMQKCPDTAEKLLALTDLTDFKTSSFEFLQSERVLRIRRPTSAAGTVTTGCRLVRIRYVFHPRLGMGNFSQREEGVSVFSGPIFPIWKGNPVPAYFEIQNKGRNLDIHCSLCRKTAAGVHVLEYTALPPPLHLSEAENQQRLTLVNLQPDEQSREMLESSRFSEFVSTLSEFRDFVRPALTSENSKSLQTWRLDISWEVLIERLVAEQSGEIQLHASFGQVTPLLSGYHKAALFRALARSLVRHLLSESRGNQGWSEQRTHEKVARIIAELWLREAFPKLSTLRDMSDRYSFIPFFRAIQQGNAFLNNQVFVGGEESVNGLDYDIFDDFFAPMKGSELIERIDSCLTEQARNKVRSTAIAIAKGTSSAKSFVQFLTALQPTDDCAVKWEKGLIPAWTAQEKIEIRGGGGAPLQLVRKVVERARTRDFLFADEQLARDTLRVRIGSEHGLFVSNLFKADGADESFADLPNTAVAAEVLPPHRALSSERLQYPRPIRTVLQALALNYDSRRSDITLKSQIQTTQSGDDWNRALTLGLRHEDRQNYLDLQFSTKIPSLFSAARADLSVASTTRFVRSPPSFLTVSHSLQSGAGSLLYPEGIGLRVWLRRPMTLSAFREVMPDPNQEWLLSAAVSLAPRLTWSQSVGYALSDNPVDAGLRNVPAWPAQTFQSVEYVHIRSEFRHTLTQNLNASIARSVLFQHAMLYGAHVLAVDDLQAVRQGAVNARTAQSVVAGVRLLGSLFGAKDQAMGFEIARALSEPARNSFGFSVGKAVN
ncbi:MAG: hypothetical protein RLZZ488_1545 [Pseudomonadota bacterium]